MDFKYAKGPPNSSGRFGSVWAKDTQIFEFGSLFFKRKLELYIGLQLQYLEKKWCTKNI